MPGKVCKLIKKPTATTHDAHHHQAAAAAANPYSPLKFLLRYDHEKKTWLAIGPAQRLAEKAAKAKAEKAQLLEAKEKAVQVKEFEEARSKSEQEAPKVKHHRVPTMLLSRLDASPSDYSLFESKLDAGATKRKLHDSYQQLGNTKKKRRRIQVIDPRDLLLTQLSLRLSRAVPETCMRG